MRDRILPVARPEMARNDALSEVATDLAPMHRAVRAVSVMGIRANHVPATRDQTTNAPTETAALVAMRVPAVTPDQTVTRVRRECVVMAVPRAHVREAASVPQTKTVTVGPVRLVTEPTVLPTPGAPRGQPATNVRRNALVARDQADVPLLVLTVVTRVKDVKLAATPIDVPALRRVGHEARQVTGRARHRVGEEQHGPRVNSPRKR